MVADSLVDTCFSKHTSSLDSCYCCRSVVGFNSECFDSGFNIRHSSVAVSMATIGKAADSCCSLESFTVS